MILYLSVWIIAITFHGDIIVSDKTKDNKIKVQIRDHDESSQLSILSEQIGFPHILFTMEFWFLYIIAIIITGVGLSYINNISQIIESSGSTATNDNKSKSVSDSLVTLSAFGNFLGRIAAGYISDKYSPKYPRIFFLFYAGLFMTLSNGYLFIVSYWFYDINRIWTYFIGSLMIGFSFGWMITLNISAVADLWGREYLSGNYALVDSAPIVGSIIFSTLIFSKLYLHESDTENVSGYCYGNGCFKWQFLIGSASGCLAIIVWAILWYKIRRRVVIPSQ